jgi:hypothetical protein
MPPDPSFHRTRLPRTSGITTDTSQCAMNSESTNSRQHLLHAAATFVESMKTENADLSDLRLSDELFRIPPLILGPGPEVKAKIPKGVADILLHEQGKLIIQGRDGNA